MGSRTTVTPPVRQGMELQLHVRYDYEDGVPLSELLEQVNSLIETARGDGTIIRAVLTGLPNVLYLNGSN